MKRQSSLFFYIFFFCMMTVFSGSLESQENPKPIVSEGADAGSEVISAEEESPGSDAQNAEFVVRKFNQEKKRRYALTFQILDPVLKSLVSVRQYSFSGTEDTSRLIIPSVSFESQFELHRYVSLGIKGSIIPELFSNPFYSGKRSGQMYSDPEYTYPDASLDEDSWANRVYNDESEYYLNMHFLVDLTVRVLPFGEGLDTLKGFYIKAGGYFGFSIFQNVYLSYENSQSASVSGEISSSSIPFFYPVEVDESGNGEELYKFVFGVVAGVGWQFTFPSGFFMDLGADVTYDNTRKLIPSVPGLGWNANWSIGYAW